MVLARILAWVRRHAPRALRERAPVAGAPRKALVTWHRENSTRLFFVFQGKKMQLMMEPLAFFRETGLLNVNLVMLGDDQGFFYHAGLSRELPSFDAILAHLASCRGQMAPVRETHCLGSSAGGYAAILFGHYLGVDTVCAFAPQTLIDLKRLQARTGRKDTWRFPPDHLDLALLLATHNGRTRYKVFYCEGHEEDRGFAQRIAACPGVELYPQPGDTHVVVQEMHKRGTLRDLLADPGT